MRSATPKRFVFQPLTCIRQTGIARQGDGTAIYTFVAEVSRDIPAVRLRLTVTPELRLSITACFDEGAREQMSEREGHREGEASPLAQREAGR